MYITPRTHIRLLRECPCDPEYTNTIHWFDKSSQENYFKGLTKYNLDNYSYQRYDKNKIRVEIVADNLYDINYMMFQNSAYGNKWFYAFVTKIEYVNDVTTEITYEIDDMQTWYTDFDFNPCFVERQHNETDKIGDNIIPESVDCGEYIFNSYSDISNFEEVFDLKHIVTIVGVIDIDTFDQLSADGTMFEKMYTGVKLYAFDNNYSGIEDKINALINQYTKNPDSITIMYTAPYNAIENTFFNDGVAELTFSNATAPTRHINLYEVSSGVHLDGYVPKNNKLYTYPYSFCNIDNGRGNSIIIRHEFCVNNTPRVGVYLNVLAPVNVVLQPENYKRANGILHTESLTLDNYPFCNWSIDAFKAWIAQNAGPATLSFATKAAGVAATAMVGVMTGGIAPMAAALVGGTALVTSTLSKGYQASIAADLSRGEFNSGSTGISHNIQTFFVARVSVNSQNARIIDDYFTRYGYAQNKLMKPNRFARGQWTYVKTIGCTLKGKLPAEAEKHIQEIMDKGITFWVEPNNVGNYLINNPVLRG